MNRRDALRTLAAGASAGALVGGMAIMATPSAAFAELDPIFSVIETHKATWLALNELNDSEHPAWDETSAADEAAWEDVCETHPTTLAGLAALASYVERHGRRAGLITEDGIGAALLTISIQAARFAYLDGRA